jgi:hypothetical protein
MASDRHHLLLARNRASAKPLIFRLKVDRQVAEFHRVQNLAGVLRAKIKISSKG